MKRVMIIGFSGAGKSTLARMLGEKLNITPIYMDRLHWKPGWVESTADEKTEKLRPVLEQEKWIIEGSYRRILFEERLKLADTIIFLDFNRVLCFFRAVKRRIMYHNKTRPDMGEGCKEKLDLEFVKWLLYEGRKKNRFFYDVLGSVENKDVYIFHRPNQVKRFLENIEL